LAPAPALAFQSGPSASQSERQSDAFPQQPPELVRETVGASHANLAKVRELVTAYPELAKSSWDWGFGDWESPLEAASHTGQREIALFLMEHGARPSLFTFAMLGNLEAVKAALAAHPEQIKTPGPHGLTLLHHAEVGGENAKAVFDYLKSAGAVDTEGSVPAKELIEALAGEYKAAGEDITLVVEANKLGHLAVRGNSGIARGLIRLSRLNDRAWHPAGAPSVQLRFEPTEGTAKSLTVTMGGRTIRAARA
jgi:hypothetical protein